MVPAFVSAKGKKFTQQLGEKKNNRWELVGSPVLVSSSHVTKLVDAGSLVSQVSPFFGLGPR